ncbi:pilus assembly protein [Teredinibacter haidensis]|uniref:pilus assembly protein n=1 Tax=Teredinibacter haidensis TaxID=2731755 RepID=UPI000948B6EB|nr:PilC/PilY family type IV pilus protein [Teredinibacter haidensis]
MKIQEKISALSGMLFAIMMSSATTAVAATLDLANEPLFLGISTDPNVFFQLDDSGSMDWEILTVPYYHFCQYDKNAAGDSGNHDCHTSVRDDGLWRVYGGGTYLSLNYLFNEGDNAYPSDCTTSYYFWAKNMESCGFSSVLSHDWRGASSDFNVTFYNPRTKYNPWAGTGLPHATFSAARSDPQPAIPAVAAQAETVSLVAIPSQVARPATSGYSSSRNLENFTYYVWVDSHGFDTADGYPKRGTNINRTVGANGWVDLWDNYYAYTVKSSSVEWEEIEWSVDATTGVLTPSVVDSGSFSGADSDPNISPALTTAQIQQNIADWYSYARRRAFVAKGAVGAVISGSPSFRFGQTVINQSYTLFNEVPPASVSKYSGYNQALLNDLYSYNWPSHGTPLRKGLETAGEYIAGNLSGKTDPIIESCQQNFAVLFTDGYWNGGAPSSTISDRDSDGRSITVADVAKYYYDHDLVSTMPNNVVPNIADPEEYQHLVTFPVAFGVKGELADTDTPSDGWPNPVLKSDDTWGKDPLYHNVGKIDDLWHAAFNSKGEYVAAQTPDDVLNSLLEALSEISSRDAASASVATSTGQISSSTAVFQAQFNSGDWSGRLYSYPLNADNTVNTTSPNWQASKLLDLQDYNTGRTIITSNGSQGVKFRFPADYRSLGASDISAGQLAQLMVDAPYPLSATDGAEITANQVYGEQLVDYLRGDRSNEGVSIGQFRPRASVLGDIVDSDPQYVSKPSYFYPDTLESKTYSSFRTAYTARAPMVYVGANDGMLHGFSAVSGQEKLAYVPSSVYENLHELADPAYFHRFFVNAAPTIVDAFYSGDWHTVLAGAMGHGGQGVFALDVTNPGGFNETAAASIYLWEFDDTDDADMGYSYSVPSIAKMADGTWVAVFGNGYNNTVADGHASSTGNSVLYIVDISNGSILRKIDTGIGGGSIPNGLSSPALVDVDNDYIVDFIYAGDLYGNMWKFDVTSTNPVDWDTAWGSGSTKKPLYKTASNQPITTRPAVGLHPTQGGQMVYFGTGKYIEVTDNNSIGEPTQGFYGIWDRNETSASGLPVVVGDLLNQEIEHEFATTLGGTDYNLRITTNNVIDWASHEGWYMDLVNYNVSPVDNAGERQVSNAILRNGRIIFPTVLPSSAPCTPGGTSWLMELDAADGSRLDETPFDLDGDGVFTKKDYDYLDSSGSSLSGIPKVPTSGLQSPDGVIKTPGILRYRNAELKILSGSTGAIKEINEDSGDKNIGRQSWRELE